VARSASIETRLRNVSAINALLLIVAGLFGAVSLKVASTTVQDVVSRLDPVAEANREILQALTDAETSGRGFIVTGAPRFVDRFAEAADAFDARLARARDLAGDDAALHRLLDAQADTGHRWLTTWAVPLLDVRQADPARAQELVATDEGARLFDRFRRANADTQDAIASDQQAAAQRVWTTADAMTVLGLAVTMGAAMVGFLLARRAARWVTGPLRALGTGLARLTGGDLAARVAVAGPSEVTEVAGAFNGMAGEMERLTDLERQRADEERLIRQTAGEFLQHLEEDGVLRAAAASIGPAMGVDRIAIWDVNDRNAGRLRATWNASGSDRRDDARPPTQLADVVRAAIDSYGVARVDDVDVDPVLSPEARAYLQQLGVRSILLAPLFAFEEEAAVLCIERCRDARPWSASDMAIAQGVARELRVALEHARVFARQRATVDELRRLDEAKAMFISAVSHELRTPLTSIVGYTELLLDGDAGDLERPQHDMLEVVDRNGRRLLALIDDLLLVSRIDAGALPRERAPVAVGDVIDSAVTAVSPLLTNRDLVVRGEHPPGLPPVLADRDELERVLINLLSNAFKFTSDGGSVSVRASAEAGEVLIAVTDTGAGIPEHEQQEVFSRFFRSTVTRDAQVQGTGLGLTIVKGIVEDHGGHVDVHSILGAGTTFTVGLPAAGPSGDRAVIGAGEVRSLSPPAREY
jgi:two-component system phosphate regulon sensor histidine kinase PhoR